MENCEWCDSAHVDFEYHQVHWELPDGTRAIKIVKTPTVKCRACQMSYQNEKKVLFLYLNRIKNHYISEFIQ
jgi:uncharacterized YokU family protein